MFSITSKLNTTYPNIEKRVKFVFLKGGKTKQWPLAGKFVEFEYSPKWPFWKIGRTRYIRRHWPPYFARTRDIRPTFANHFARTRQARERQVWQLLHEFSEFSEFGEFSECRLDRFIHKNIFFCI